MAVHQQSHQRGGVGPCARHLNRLPQFDGHGILPAVAPLPSLHAAPRRHHLQRLPRQVSSGIWHLLLSAHEERGAPVAVLPSLRGRFCRPRRSVHAHRQPVCAPAAVHAAGAAPGGAERAVPARQLGLLRRLRPLARAASRLRRGRAGVPRGCVDLRVRAPAHGMRGAAEPAGDACVHNT